MPDRSAKAQLSDLLRRTFMRRATVTASENLGQYRLITLEGPELRGVHRTPGQKIQIAMDKPLTTRTYTPIDWDEITGRTRILCFIHGNGPGSDWAANVSAGDACYIFGPRRSIDIGAQYSPIALFGDETSIGLAQALISGHPERAIVCHFEADDTQAIQTVLTRFGIEKAVVISEFEAMGASRLLELTTLEATFVLTSRAATIQSMNQNLKRMGVPSGRIATKAYWAPGKIGLD